MVAVIESVPLVHYQDVLEGPHHNQESHQYQLLEDPTTYQTDQLRPTHQKVTNRIR